MIIVFPEWIRRFSHESIRVDFGAYTLVSAEEIDVIRSATEMPVVNDPINRKLGRGMLTTIEKFIRNYNDRELESTLECFSESPPAFAFGSGVEERRIGLSQIREQLIQDWEQSRSSMLKVNEIVHGLSDHFGWAAVELDVALVLDCGVKNFPARASFVLYRDGSSSWKIVHMHFSIPANE